MVSAHCEHPSSVVSVLGESVSMLCMVSVRGEMGVSRESWTVNLETQVRSNQCGQVPVQAEERGRQAQGLAEPI